MGDIGRGLHGRFRDPDDAGRDLVGEAAEEVLVEFERAEIAGVDTDETRPDLEGTGDLIRTVGLDERRHAELGAEVEETRECRLVESGHDEQHDVGTGCPRLEHLVWIGDEVLAQHGHPHRIAHGLEIGERASEPAPLGQHADGARAAGLIRDGQRGRIRDVREGAARRAGAFDLRDDLHPVGRCERLERIDGRRARKSSRFDLGEAACSTTFRSIL